MQAKMIVLGVLCFVSNLYAAEKYKLENPLTKVIIDSDEDSSIIIDSDEDSFESRNITYVNARLSFNDLPPDIVRKILVVALSGNPRHEGPLSTVCKAWNDTIHDTLFAQYIIQRNPSYYADRDRLKADYNNNEAMRAELTQIFLKIRRAEERRNVKIDCWMGIPCCTILGTGLGGFIGFVGLPFDPLITFAIPVGIVVGLATGISIRLYYRCYW